MQGNCGFVSAELARTRRGCLSVDPKGNGSRKRDTKIDKEELISIGVLSRDMGGSGRNPRETSNMLPGWPTEKVMVYTKQNRNARIVVERKRPEDSEKEHVELG